MARFVPLDGRVLIRRHPVSETTPGGIALPDTAKEKPLRGTVVAVSEGRTTPEGDLIIPTVTVGDEVVFTTFSGTPIKHDGEELLVMREADLIGVLRE